MLTPDCIDLIARALTNHASDFRAAAATERILGNADFADTCAEIAADTEAARLAFLSVHPLPFDPGPAPTAADLMAVQDTLEAYDGREEDIPADASCNCGRPAAAHVDGDFGEDGCCLRSRLDPALARTFAAQEDPLGDLLGEDADSDAPHLFAPDASGSCWCGNGYPDSCHEPTHAVERFRLSALAAGFAPERVDAAVAALLGDAQ